MQYVYIAEPIDAFAGTRQPLAQMLAKMAISSYSPVTAWSVPPGVLMDERIDSVNTSALLNADVLLAWLPAGVVTYGVPIEIDRAIQCDTPVVVISDRKQDSSATMAALEIALWTNDIDQALAKVRSLLAVAPEPSAHEAECGRAVDLETRGILFDKLMDFVAEATVWPDPVLEGRFMGGGAPPRTGKPGDAGYDLVASEDTLVHPWCRAQIPTDIAVELPEDMWALIQGRSSSWARGLSVKASVIDAGYRGMLWADVWNITNEAVLVRKGERVAQLIPMALHPPIVWHRVDSLSATERGDSGYGSTGR